MINFSLRHVLALTGSGYFIRISDFRIISFLNFAKIEFRKDLINFKWTVKNANRYFQAINAQSVSSTSALTVTQLSTRKASAEATCALLSAVNAKRFLRCHAWTASSSCAEDASYCTKAMR
jgi:hypothetical protein